MQATQGALECLRDDYKIQAAEVLPELCSWDRATLPWFFYEGMPLPPVGESWYRPGANFFRFDKIMYTMDCIFCDVPLLEAFCSAFGWDLEELVVRYKHLRE